MSDPELDRVREVFARNFAEREELGASVSVWKDGEEVLSLAHGFANRERTRAWTAETLVPVWSATKGPSAACALTALADAGIPLDHPVATVWPEIDRRITFRHLLNHQGGLSALDATIDVFDYEAVVAALEEQSTHWEPGTAHGYHPRTFGFLLDEIVRRVTGAASLGAYWREKFGDPLGLDFWIGLPESEHARVARVYPGKMRNTGDESAFYEAFADPASLTRKAFSSPSGIAALSGMNDSRALQAGFPAMGGVGTAAALARFYAMLPSEIVDLARETHVDGADRTFLLPTAFAHGFMKDPVDPVTRHKTRRHFGPSPSAFGHPGAGGSHAFFDPDNGIAFAYVMNQMSYGVLPNEKSLDMVAAIYRELR